MRQIRPRLTQSEYYALKEYRNQTNNILVIPDIHAPFCLPDYLDFCKDVEIRYNCSQVVFLFFLISLFLCLLKFHFNFILFYFNFY